MLKTASCDSLLGYLHLKCVRVTTVPTCLSEEQPLVGVFRV